ncbi:MAG: YeeE/YedE thiosulfate transporter family protein, partial [Rhodoferax sp.]
MNFASLIESHGEQAVLALGGLVIGALFGFFAQRSRFCLRAATLEFWHRSFGTKVAVWLLAFSSAVVGVQWLILSGNMDAASTRQISATGSISGALVGGLLFGVGMVLTRG